MTGAMYAAVAGLRAHMSALNVIGQNISNVNTNAYKATRYTFLEALYTTVRGGSNGSALLGGKNPAQNGYGSSIGTIDLDMSTKNYTPTGRATDVMIDGDGMLIVGDKTATFGKNGTNKLSDMFLTRLGNLEFDNQGYLVDGQGQVVYGFLSVKNPIYEAQMGDPTKLPPRLDANPAPTITAGNYYLDKDGQLVQVTDVDATTGAYKVKVIDEYTPAPTLTAIRLPMMASLVEEDIKDANGNVTGKKTVTKLGDALYPTYDKTTGEVKDVDDPTKCEGRRCKVDSISIDENTGRITCTTSSGQAIVVGTIAIAKVDNPNGLTHVDGHYYKALDGAGDVSLTSVGFSVKNTDDPESPFYDPAATTHDMTGAEERIISSGTTKLISGGLESSGTDLASEISNMIMIQRGYQANTRIVTVTDSMLEELVNMKR
ncbi:flagellar hook-basal body complex protein [Acutalibacter sp. 1XD8-33]|uniref:flagellar hook-basal body complex protein n=1 Tax=Acutalibacter sp. 1XD8-33 TaxID=2320081 RepID=UPI000EA29C53|nr:flagellar hook-basal body complex protein [Acutalibacter sp. 1XD8-33]RKJ42101.1 flagellar hook-basal body complex protein [Acutalibacter sp. 1XD8-33]